MTSVKSIIDQSLRKLGVLGAGEQAGPEEHSDALQALRTMLDTWSLEALMIPFTATEEFELSPSQCLYSMGPDGDWVTTRPTQVEQVRVKSSDGRTTFVRRTSRNGLRDQATVDGGTPTGWIGSADSLAWFIEFNAFPQEPRVLVTSRKPFDVTALDNFDQAHVEGADPAPLSPSGFTMTGIQSVLAFPPGYESAIVYNLALHLSVEYTGVVVPDLVVAQAARTKALIKIANWQPSEMKLPATLTRMVGRRGAYDIGHGPG